MIEGTNLLVQGTLNQKEYKNNQYIYYLKNCYVSFQTGVVPCNQIMAYLAADECSIGETLVLRGEANHFKTAVNEGNFDEKSFYESQNIDFKLNNTDVEAVFGKQNRFREKLFCFRQSVKQVYASLMNETDSGVMATMTLGDKSLLDQEIKELYQKAGISHILAISGLHISVIGMSLYRILKKAGLTFGEAGMIAAGIMISYGLLTGFGTSTARAILMFLLMLLSQILGRSYDTLSALSLSAILLLWDNPFLLTYAGFLFSFAAVLGAVVLGKNMVSIMKTKKGRGESVWIGFSIQLATLPLAAYYYYEIPVYAMAVNLFVLPLLNVLLSFGIIGGILGMKIPLLGKAFLFPCHLILISYQYICRFCEKLFFASFITGKPRIQQIIGYYLLLGILFGIPNGIEKNSGKPIEKEVGKKSALKEEKRSHRKRKFAFFLGCAVAFAVLFWHPKKEFELAVLDVGQGDGIFLQTGSGHCLFLDGGSTDVSKVGTYRILPFLKAKGVRKIDYWLVSHGDTDHISGFTEIIESEYPVGTLILSDRMIQDDAYQKLLELAKKYGIEVLFLRQGDCLYFGNGVLKCLFPDNSYTVEDRNAMSLVVSYEEAGFSGIFTGDIDSDAESHLAASGILQDVIFYKAAHHGSSYSSSEEVLRILQPEIAVISCAKQNRYGHPGAETVKRLKTVESEIFYTMESGQITVKLEKEKEIRVYGFTDAKSPLDVLCLPVVE